MAIYVQMNNKSYRKGVGIIIVNSDLQFFLGKRIGADAWQFPQGGIDEGETPEEALYRELYEETGLERDKIEILSLKSFSSLDLSELFDLKFLEIKKRADTNNIAVMITISITTKLRMSNCLFYSTIVLKN